MKNIQMDRKNQLLLDQVLTFSSFNDDCLLQVVIMAIIQIQ